jgi:uncharacterized protein (TIGR02266 family)
MDVPIRARASGAGPLRRSARVDLEVSVRFRWRRGSGVGLTKNLGSGGLFVSTLRTAVVGDRVVLRLTFPHDPAPVEVLGEVRWRRSFQELDDRPPGWGVRFIDTPVRASFYARRSRAGTAST